MLQKKQLKEYFNRFPNSLGLCLFSKDALKKNGKFYFKAILHQKDFKQAGVHKIKHWNLKAEFESCCQDMIDDFFYSKKGRKKIRNK